MTNLIKPRKIELGEKLILDNSIQKILLKDQINANQIWPILFKMTDSVGNGNIILTPFAAIESIGLNLNSLYADFKLSPNQETALINLRLRPEVSFKAAISVFKAMFHYYLASLKKNPVLSYNSIQKHLENQESYVGPMSMPWFKHAISKTLAPSEYQYVLSRLALDRVFETAIVPEARLGLMVLMFHFKYRSQPEKLFKNVGMYRLSQKYFQTLFSIEPSSQLPKQLIEILDNAQLGGREDFLDAESITFLAEGYSHNPVVYLTMEPRKKIASRLRVAIESLNYACDVLKLNPSIIPGRIIFFNKNFEAIEEIRVEEFELLKNVINHRALKVKNFFADSNFLDKQVLRPLSHILPNWELTWDHSKKKYREENDSFARELNKLILELSSVNTLKHYHEHEDTLAEYVITNLKWDLQKKNGRWINFDYESILEQGGFEDIDEKNLILAAAGRIHAALERGQLNIDEMESGHFKILGSVLSVILYHRHTE